MPHYSAGQQSVEHLRMPAVPAGLEETTMPLAWTTALDAKTVAAVAGGRRQRRRGSGHGAMVAEDVGQTAGCWIDGVSMLNNHHGVASFEMRSSDTARSCPVDDLQVDRGDSDEDDGELAESNGSAEEQQLGVKRRCEIAAPGQRLPHLPCHQLPGGTRSHQHHHQLIIPRRLHLDGRRQTQPDPMPELDRRTSDDDDDNSGGATSSRLATDGSSCCGGGGTDSTDCEASDEMIFQPTTNTTASVSTNTTSYGGDVSARQEWPSDASWSQSPMQSSEPPPLPPPPPLPRHGQPRQSMLQHHRLPLVSQACWSNCIPDDAWDVVVPTPPLPTSSPISLTVERQVVLDRVAGPRAGQRRRRTQEQELYSPAVADPLMPVPTIACASNIASSAAAAAAATTLTSTELRQQLRAIDERRRRPPPRRKQRQKQQQQQQQQQHHQTRQERLCTSSSNCCGGCFRRGKPGESSAESSVNLVSGAAVLGRPGSLPGINIDGLSARRLRCYHEPAARQEELQDDEEDEPGDAPTARTSAKKSVSFSASLQRDAAFEGPSEGGSTESARPSKTKLGLVNTDTEISELESDSRADRGVSLVVTATSKRGRHAQPTAATAAVTFAEDEETVANVSAVSRHSEGNMSTAGSDPPDISSEDMSAGQVVVSSSATHAKGQSVSSTFRLAAETFDVQMAESTSNAQECSGLAAGVELCDESNTTASSCGGPKPMATNNRRKKRQPVPTGSDRQLNDAQLDESALMKRRPAGGAAGGAVGKRVERRASDKPRGSRTVVNVKRLAHSSGSNCANSAIAAGHLASHGGHQSSSTRSAGYCTWASADGQSDDDEYPMHDDGAARRKLADRNGVYVNGQVVFQQHPPEVATAASRSGFGHAPRESSGSDSGSGGVGGSGGCGGVSLEGDNCSDSIAFSWVTTLGNASNEIDLSLSLDSASNASSRLGSSRRHDTSTGNKVVLNQLNTSEGQLSSIQAAAPAAASLRVGDVCGDACVRAIAVRNSVLSIVRSVARPARNERAVAHCDSTTESESSQPFLMLEALSCGHKDLDSTGCSINCRSCQSPRRPRQPPPPKPQPPPPSPPLMSSSSARPMATSATAAAAAVAVQDLLSSVCTPAEAAALTGALVRGLVCNVESLRSALTATLLLLRDRRCCSGPLTQAIGTADTLDELIRRVQANQEWQQQHQQQQRHQHQHQHQHQRRRQRQRRLLQQLRHQQQQQQQQQRGGVPTNWRRQSAPDSATSPSSAESDSRLEEADDDDANDVDNDDEVAAAAAGRGDPLRRASSEWRRLPSSPAAPVSALQCQAMAHYVIGEQFVEPSLEQRPSLECRPITTRVVPAESSKTVNLLADASNRRPPRR